MIIDSFRFFYNNYFFTNQFTLDPRSDSEILVDYIINKFKYQHITILDLGIGTSCLISSIIMHPPYAIGTGIDISTQAIKVAKYNINSFQLNNRINIIQNNWLDKFEKPFDLLISNPPYLSMEEIHQYKLYDDPIIALEGGLSKYIDIYHKRYLFKYMIIEINPTHLDKLLKYFSNAIVINDYINLPRFLFIEN